jgi:hypothetical protein
MSKPVVYCRGVKRVSLDATVGRSRFQQTDDEGQLHSWESRDFLIMRADLVIDGVATKPAVGDRIEEVLGGSTYIYEVMPDSGEPSFRDADTQKFRYRIHTKQVA